MNKTDNLIIDDLLDTMPTPTVAPVEPEAIANEYAADDNTLIDAAGNSFNPSLHSIDENGQPKMTKKGEFAKKRGRAGAANKSTLNTPHAATIEATGANFEAMGAMLAGLFFGVATTLGGAEFAPENHEKPLITQAFADYAKSKNYSDLPPSLALLGALSIYILPRMTKPAVKKRADNVKTKLAAWWFNRKLAKQKHAEKAALDNEKAMSDGA